MEYYQTVQQRSRETAAVVKSHVPTLKVSGFTGLDLLERANAMPDLAQTRDDILVDLDGANNDAAQNFLLIRLLDLALPQAAIADLDPGIKAEAKLIALFDAALAIVPRTPQLALARGKKVVSALGKVNAYLAGLPTPRGPITVGGRGLPELKAAMTARPALEQKAEDFLSDATTARTNLRSEAIAIAGLNSRFLARLEAEARSNPDLATALGQITTGSEGLPGTLGIHAIVQGGVDGLHVLVTYDAGNFEPGVTASLEHQVVGKDADFSHSTPADPSGNALGPFTAGQTVRIRTRTRNSHGTTTGSVRTLKVLPPVT